MIIGFWGLEIWVNGKADVDKVQEGKGKDLYDDSTTVSTAAAATATYAYSS